MNLKLYLELLALLQIVILCHQNSYAEEIDKPVAEELRSLKPKPLAQLAARPSTLTQRYTKHQHHDRAKVHRVKGHRNHWSGGRGKPIEHQHFTTWSAWSSCDNNCIKRRERFCKTKRKCGHTKHVEEQKCSSCHSNFVRHSTDYGKSLIHQQEQQQQTINHGPNPPSIIINAAAAAASVPRKHVPHDILPIQQQKQRPIYRNIHTPIVQETVDHDYHQADYRQHRNHYNKNKNQNHQQQQYYQNYHYQNNHDEYYDDDIDDSRQLTDNENSEYIRDTNNEDLYVVHMRRPSQKKKRKRKPIIIDPNAYDEILGDEHNDFNDDFDYNIDEHQHIRVGELPASDLHANRIKQLHAISVRNNNAIQRLREQQQQLELEQQMELQQQLELQQKQKELQQKWKYNSIQHNIRSNRDHVYRDREKYRDRDRGRGRGSVRDGRMRNLSPNDDGIEGDTFQYEDFDFDADDYHRISLTGGEGERGLPILEERSSESYEDYNDMKNSSQWSITKEREALIPRHRRLYSKWSRWTKCTPKCTTRRYKKCRVREQCGREVLREIAYCYTEGSFCQQWLQAQMHKAPAFSLRPVAASRRRDFSDGIESNSVVSDFIMNGKGYRGPEYMPLKLKCGLPHTHRNNNNKRKMFNMLKIIGGKAARKGDWPWQVAIINRFREAFCGGTLIAPQWILTAAHCVRKVLFVRIGEHNLDHDEGTEFSVRVARSFKHPNFDKNTVDSDVALLKLKQAVNATNWIGYSCLPHPYQPLPKNVDCTVIGWGKRRNRDVAGTSVLHEASVPIIPMDNCRAVYQDYTITKNMFCAGHKRGRIDTCAGDSGGPLLCRDTTKPNHPWTIFGITSFGDGCAKRNKFGIYAKVPNYVDWVWSVINCNGNCKLTQHY